jgi:L-threonylcarbamoyladenylate synthase
VTFQSKFANHLAKYVNFMKIKTLSDLHVAVQVIKSGGIAVVPTQRWYMICCDASNIDACTRIYRAKCRPEDKSLLLVVPSKDDLYKHFNIYKDTEILIESLCPGDLALLLKWSNSEMGSKYRSVGSEIALVSYLSGVIGSLAKQTSMLIAATSVNISKLPTESKGPAITIEEVLTFIEDTKIDVEVIIDGGICPQFNHTTVIDCSEHNSSAKIIREGAVHRRAIEAVLRREMNVLNKE